MVDLDAPLTHHLLELPVADRIRDIPAHTLQDDILFEVTVLEVNRHRLIQLIARLHHTADGKDAKLATEPMQPLSL
jgi:hypothetical protein